MKNSFSPAFVILISVNANKNTTAHRSFLGCARRISFRSGKVCKCFFYVGCIFHKFYRPVSRACPSFSCPVVTFAGSCCAPSTCLRRPICRQYPVCPAQTERFPPILNAHLVMYLSDISWPNHHFAIWFWRMHPFCYCPVGAAHPRLAVVPSWLCPQIIWKILFQLSFKGFFQFARPNYWPLFILVHGAFGCNLDSNQRNSSGNCD